jgi:hypothetical protein
MTTGIALNDAEKVLKNFDSTKDYVNINEVLELYNIQRMLDSGIRLVAWTEKRVAEYQDVTKKFSPIIGHFFSDITGENFARIFNQVDIDYIEDFWTVFTDNKVYLNVPNNQFSEFLNTNHDALLFILPNKHLVTYYGTEIAEYMIKANESAELLMTH